MYTWKKEEFLFSHPFFFSSVVQDEQFVGKCIFIPQKNIRARWYWQITLCFLNRYLSQPLVDVGRLTERCIPSWRIHPLVFRRLGEEGKQVIKRNPRLTALLDIRWPFWKCLQIILKHFCLFFDEKYNFEFVNSKRHWFVSKCGNICGPHKNCGAPLFSQCRLSLSALPIFFSRWFGP